MKCAKGNIGSRDVVMLENGEDMVIYWEGNYDAFVFCSRIH